MEYIIEPEKQIPVKYKCDVLVAGAGTAGALAAVAAAASGVSVMLIESLGGPGGTATAGLVTPLMHTHIKGNPMCSGLSDEINKRTISRGGGFASPDGNAGHFDPLVLEAVLDEMLTEAGVVRLYSTMITGAVCNSEKITAVIAENKGGRFAVEASRYIDSTGDADLAVFAGAPFEAGHPETGKNQPVSLRYVMGGVDIPVFAEFLKERYGRAEYNPPVFHEAMVWGGNWPIEDIFKEAVDSGDLEYEDGLYWQAFGIPGRRDCLAFNCPEFFERTNGVDPEDLTAVQVAGRKAIFRQMKFCRKYLPGFKDCYVNQIAPMVGIRETRRIKGLYILTDNDLLRRKKFPDYIAQSNYPVDIHGKSLDYGKLPEPEDDGKPWYEIPFRSLIPVGVDNLIVAGRCISASFLAQSSLRVQPTVRALGEAAGIAAWYSLKHNIKFRDMDGAAVREEMVRRGAFFAENK